MPYYVFHLPDSKADSGFHTVVIRAMRQERAKAFLHEHLVAINRLDLLPRSELIYRTEEGEDIVYTNVEPRPTAESVCRVKQRQQLTSEQVAEALARLQHEADEAAAKEQALEREEREMRRSLRREMFSCKLVPGRALNTRPFSRLAQPPGSYGGLMHQRG